MREPKSSGPSRAIDTGRAVVKEIVREPVKEAVREAIDENEELTGEPKERFVPESTERETEESGRNWRARAALGLVALAGVTYYAKRRRDSRASEGTRDSGEEARTGTVADVSETGTSDPVAVESGGMSDIDDTYTMDDTPSS